MNLLSLFKKKTVDDSHYLGLFLKGNEVTGFVFNVTDKSCEIRAQEKIAYTNGLETILQDVDSLISQLETQSGIHLQKTIFFLYAHMIDQKSKDIKKQYKSIIKSLVKNLELEPLGYIECHEAIASHLQNTEHSPLNAIVTEIDSEYVNIAIYKGGTLTYSQSQMRLNPLPQDVDSLLEEAKAKTVLPAKLVIYHSAGNEDDITALVNYAWPADIFSQMPKVELIATEELYQALIDTFTQQISLVSQKFPEKAVVNEPGAEKFGFYIGQDVQEQTMEAEGVAELPPVKKSKLPDFKQLFSKIKLPAISGTLLPRLLILIGVIVVLGIITASEFFFHKTTIAIFLPSKNIKKTISYSSADGGSFSVKNSAVTAEYTESVLTTGKRDVGEKAHGEVTINSFDDKERLITQGTQVTVNNLSFVLDNDVKVASASVDGDIKKAGKANVAITASNIGPDYNLGKNQRFAIADLSSSDFFAINDDALAGGSKKTVKTVAKKDLDDLKTKILAEAIQKVPSDTQSKNDDKIIIQKLTDSKLIDSQYSKEVGEEADQVTLKSKVELNYYYYTDNEMKKFISAQLKDNFPADFIIDPTKIHYRLVSASKDDSDINLKIDTDVTAIKKASYESILEALKGKPKSSLQQIVTNTFHADHYQIVQSSKLPLLDNWMPFWKKNITLQITSH